ncbi:NADP-dependent oxidoreductase [Curtobacterium sp. MCPF17_021]|uniref:NADP-dependent oxidoreductase n=1 Tax=Curtobacterium sp. MCPF17_021 TaxID=2175639 RepID=UPI000DA8A505|nr:NADP-dependent oxidoreductase [Curtobacterium sp. MCPF17_021]WIE83709.1 NADP-dependent oxidoreductase [Curtobacterium sp. MCPF17_021]
MKAVQFTSYGSPDVLHVVDVDAPDAAAGEILVQVMSAGTNQLDAKLRSGLMANGEDLPAPSGTGFDASGTVIGVGAGVADVEPGDVVFGIGRNTLAEQAVLTAWAKVPAGVDPVEAGGWGVAAETSHRLLTELGVEAGTIVVSGASGGVGSALIQMATTRGLRVIGTAGEKNQSYLEALGAVPITYGAGLVDRVTAVAPDGVDGALDLSGAGVIGDLIALVGDPSRVISISDFTAPQLGARVSTGAGRTTSPRDGLAEAAAVPGFALHVDRRFELADAASAHRAAEAGHTRGKLIVIP